MTTLEVLKTQTFPDDYRPLTAKLERLSLFLSELWFENFLKTVVKHNETIIWCGLKDLNGNPLFLMPLWQKPHSAWNPNKLTSLSNYYTTLYEPLHCIADKDQLCQAINQVVEVICQLDWDVIDLYALNPNSSSYVLLIKAFNQQKKHVTSYFMYANWFLVNQGDYKDYFAARPGHLKNTIKRHTNKLKQKAVEYRICKHPDDVAEAVRLFQQVYKARWKKNEPYQYFILGLAKEAADRGWLRLGLLFVDQQAAAAQLWLTLHQTAYIYKLCHDPEFGSYSPGSLLTAHLMEYAIDVDKVTKVDFLSGDDAYKKDWMSHREERWGLQIANTRTLFGLLQACKNKLNSMFKLLETLD